MDQVKTGKYIAEKRKKAGLTQNQLADKLLVTNRSVSRWENGINLPDISLFLPLCEVLGISISELINAEDENAMTENETVKQVISYSETAIREEKRKLKIVICAILVIAAFTGGAFVANRIRTEQAVKKEYVYHNAQVPFSNLDEKELVDMYITDFSGRKTDVSPNDRKQILYQLKNLNLTYFIPAASDTDKTDFRTVLHVSTLSGSFDISVAPYAIRVMDRTLLSPWAGSPCVRKTMDYTDFTELNELYCAACLQSTDFRSDRKLDLYTWKSVAGWRVIHLADSDREIDLSAMTSGNTSMLGEGLKRLINFYDLDLRNITVKPLQLDNETGKWEVVSDPGEIAGIKKELGL